MVRKFAYAALSIVPMRIEALESSEMTSQLLFGELIEILEKEKSWYLVVSHIDNYTGWVDEKMIEFISEEDYIFISNQERIVLRDFMVLVKNQNNEYPQRLLPGSFLWNLAEDSKSFSIGGSKYEILSETLNTSHDQQNSILETAKQYINSPYLWGGKTFFGIDCSGFVQMCYRQHNKYIPRDTRQQISLGKNVSFINNAKAGDLAFFENKEGEIIHIGMLIDSEKIIHASGKVRIDKIDHQGIFNEETEKYSHKLRLIKRIF